MLPGLEIFYRSIANNLKSKNESVVALVHYMLISNGFRFIGLGEQFQENAKDSKGSELLPSNWNQNEFFIFRYVDPVKKRLLMVKIIPSDAILLVNVLLKDNDQIYATTLDPSKLVTDRYQQYDELFLDDNSLSSLVNELKKEIFDKFDAKEAPKKSSRPSTEQQRPTNPLLVDDNRNPRYRPNPNALPQSGYPAPMIPFPRVGGADLDPLGRGVGGMHVDLRDLQEQFNNPSRLMQPPRNPNLQFDPSYGLETPLLPGAIPPGANFEYIGPTVRPNARGPRSRPPNHPDFNTGYDDMFM